MDATMKYREKSERERAGIPRNPHFAATAVSIISGAIAGAIIGFFMVAGWIGAFIGAIVGAFAAAGIERVSRRRDRRRISEDAILDREIGVIDGDIGAADSIPPRRGPVLSPSSSGVTTSLPEAPAAGPWSR
jgi:hypothetical protein